MDTVFVSLFELIEASRRVYRFNAMSFSMRQQKLDKFCRGCKVLRPRLTKHCRGRVPSVPGGVDAYGVAVIDAVAHSVVVTRARALSSDPDGRSL